MTYFKISHKEYSLAYYAWAANKDAAVRAVELAFSTILPKPLISAPIAREDIPDGESVVDEPEDQAEARLEDHEQEDETL